MAKIWLDVFLLGYLSYYLGMIKQFLTDVYWQDIDYLVIDTPPGTSDEHITVMENLRYGLKLAEYITEELWKQILIIAVSGNSKIKGL